MRTAFPLLRGQWPRRLRPDGARTVPSLLTAGGVGGGGSSSSAAAVDHFPPATQAEEAAFLAEADAPAARTVTVMPPSAADLPTRQPRDEPAAHHPQQHKRRDLRMPRATHAETADAWGGAGEGGAPSAPSFPEQLLSKLDSIPGVPDQIIRLMRRGDWRCKA